MAAVTFAEKIKTIQVQGFQGALNRQLERDLSLYRRARAEGSQPQGTHRQHVEHALRESDRLGRRYDAAHLADTYHPEIAKEIKPWAQSPYFPKGDDAS